MRGRKGWKAKGRETVREEWVSSLSSTGKIEILFVIFKKGWLVEDAISKYDFSRHPVSTFLQVLYIHTCQVCVHVAADLLNAFYISTWLLG